VFDYVAGVPQRSPDIKEVGGTVAQQKSAVTAGKTGNKQISTRRRRNEQKLPVLQQNLIIMMTYGII